MSNELAKKENNNLVILKEIIENNKKNAKTIFDLANSVEQLYISMLNIKEEFEYEVIEVKKEIKQIVDKQIDNIDTKINNINDKLNDFNNKLDVFDNKIPLTRSEVGVLYNIGKNKINELCIEKVNRDFVEFSQWYRKIAQRVWGKFKRHFNLTRYYDLPRKYFQEGINYLNSITLDNIDYENKCIKF